MVVNFGTDAAVARKVLDLVLQEKAISLSVREWHHRLAGYGYSIKDTERGQVVTTLPTGVEVCELPAQLAG